MDEKKFMHTKENTDINIIKQNCSKYHLENSDNNCVLITTGSLNPIHRSHINNLRLVRNYLENDASPKLNVLAGYVSPSHDLYVRQKLGHHHWISSQDRIKLCEEAIQSDEDAKSWITVAKDECAAEGFIDFDEVSTSLAEFLNTELYNKERFLAHPLKVVYVCGLDHINKCPYVTDLAKESNIACAVVYRSGASDRIIKQSNRKNSTIYYIPLDEERTKLVDISSTAIRENYFNLEKKQLDEFTYPCVIEYLNKKYVTQ